MLNTTTGLYISCATQAEALLCPIQGLQTSVIAGVGNTEIENSNQRPDGNSAEVPITEMRYWYAGISSATAGLGALCLSYQLNLGIISDTLLAVNKDLYWH